MPLLFKQRPSSKNLYGQQQFASGGGTSSQQRVSSGTGLAGQSSSGGLPRGQSTTSRNTFHSVNTLSSLGTSIAQKGKQRTRTSVGRLKIQGRRLSRYVRDPRLLVAVIKGIYQRWHLKHLIPLAFVMFYMLLGAIVFLWFEGQAEKINLAKRNQAYRRERQLFVKRIDEIMYDRAASMPLQRRRFVEEALDHFHEQLHMEPVVAEPQWSLSTAMYYCGTVFTTIGYGDVACSTVWGRILTVIYAIVGIPLMLITLTELGKFLFKTINEMVARITKLFEKTVGHKISTTNESKVLPTQKVSTGDGIAPQERRVSFKIITEDNSELTLDLSAIDDPQPGKGLSASPSIDRPSIICVDAPDAVVDLETGIVQEVIEEENYDDDLELLNEDGYRDGDQKETPRMPVLVAISCTLGWIFLCAAMFKIWETDWTYAESCYFMFISLSTIGLGDVSVKRRDLMVVCFVFVIIGLSLVSMCINVIQLALEDLYRRLLMKILLDYQAKLAQGGDHRGASVGMMRMWGSSKTAKYLMPMLSADTRLAVMHKIQEEAKETGLEIPPIFEDIDQKTGMPKILAKSKETDPERQSAIAEELVRQADAHATVSHDRLDNASARSPMPSVVCYETDAQTDIIFSVDKNDQTTIVEFIESGIQAEDQTTKIVLEDNSVQTDAPSQIIYEELAIQTEFSAEPSEPPEPLQPKEVDNASWVDEGIQTDFSSQVSTSDDETQTRPMDLSDAETMTAITSVSSLEVQTEKIWTMDQQLQTHLVDLLESEMQTEYPETKNEHIQTPYPELAEAECQTEENEVSDANKKALSKISQARRRLRKAFQSQNASSSDSGQRRVSHGDRQTLTEWGEMPEEDDQEPLDELVESEESLDWDPIDGLHAEKQRPVSDLKKMFDRNMPRRTASKKK
ncbi:ion channel domain-containing protein [Ditylenchus destructor]|nr:ion channel domain-containing protein [Ditylenchus destructor]